MRGDIGLPPKMIASSTYLHCITFAKQFLEGDITSSSKRGSCGAEPETSWGSISENSGFFEGGEGEDAGHILPVTCVEQPGQIRHYLAISWEIRHFAAP